MVPASFDESNLVLGKPHEMSVDECQCLSVFTGVSADDNPYPVVISCWKLTAEEMEEVKKTGRVWLTVIGGTMPPVCMDGIKPFTPQ